MRTVAWALVAVVALATAAAIVIPRFSSAPRGHGNETSALATLRNLASCQEQFLHTKGADVDEDGVMEYGTIGEMTGMDGVRRDATGSGPRGAAIAPALLSPALANVDGDGRASKSGYFYRVLLPSPGGVAVHEGRAGRRSREECPKHRGCPDMGGKNPPTAPCPTCERLRRNPPTPEYEPGTPFSGPVDADGAEKRWCAYAWPVAVGNSGGRAFFVDQQGDVWWTLHDLRPAARPYSGTAMEPLFDAAMPATTKAGWASAPSDTAEFTGRDGRTWVRSH